MKPLLQHPLGRGRVRLQGAQWPDRAALQVAATVGAGPPQAGLHAPRAPGALEGADHRLRRFWRQVDVAALTVRSQFKHALSIAGLGGNHVALSRHFTTVCAVMMQHFFPLS